MSTTTASLPAATTTSSGRGGPTSSPLLFFVALGFGVVFTNLWIIVGVKYCFRYNARARARAAGEDEVDLTAMPRPHRRRREKKLMSMEEVNERFPITTYKAWQAERGRLGLSKEGGVDAASTSRPASRAASLRNVAVETEPASPKPIPDATSVPLPVSPTSPPPAVNTDKPKLSSSTETADKRKSDLSDLDHSLKDKDDDEDDLQVPVPGGLLDSVGDSCAICIDTIEPDDEIRGLTCGHAFHASCVDPWLTGRRASCPLCKEDYYVPKPRTDEQVAAAAAADEARNNPPRPPPSAAYVMTPNYWRRRLLASYEPTRFGASPYAINNQQRNQTRHGAMERNHGVLTQNRTVSRTNTNTAATPATNPTPHVTEQSNSPTAVGRIRGFMSRFRRNNNEAATPGQLEAGQNQSQTSPNPATGIHGTGAGGVRM